VSTGAVLEFLRRPSHYRDWSQQEVAEFYRVESALLQGGCAVATDRGISDEGHPWFVFLRADTEEVIAHIARIDGEYVIVSSANSVPGRGRDFHLLIRRMLEAQPVMPIRRNQGQNVFLHPAALLIALLASAYMLSEKQAVGGNSPAHNDTHDDSIASLLASNFSLLAAVGLAALWFEHQADALLKFIEPSASVNESSISDNGSHHISVVGREANLLDVSFFKAESGDQASSHNLKLDLPVAQPVEQHADIWTLLYSNTTHPFNDGKFSAANDVTALSSDAAAAHQGDASQNSNEVLLNVAQLLPAKDGDAVPLSVNQAGWSSIIFLSTQSGTEAPPVSAETSAEVSASSSADNPTISNYAASVVPNDASQIVAAEFAGSSNQGIVQFSNLNAMSVSLQQQVGFGPALLQELTGNLADAENGAAPPTSADSSQIAQHATSAAADGTTASSAVENQAGASANVSTAASGGTGTQGASTTAEGEVSPSQNGSHPTSETTSHLSITLAAPSTASVERTLTAFLDNTPSYEVAMSGENVVIIDTNSADLKSAHYGVLTWDMSDGSTLTIMGILPHYHLLAAAA